MMGEQPADLFLSLYLCEWVLFWTWEVTEEVLVSSLEIADPKSSQECQEII